jgi:hypothetical protein
MKSNDEKKTKNKKILMVKTIKISTQQWCSIETEVNFDVGHWNL